MLAPDDARLLERLRLNDAENLTVFTGEHLFGVLTKVGGLSDSKALAFLARLRRVLLTFALDFWPVKSRRRPPSWEEFCRPLSPAAKKGLQTLKISSLEAFRKCRRERMPISKSALAQIEGAAIFHGIC